jgi:hypothetical protein
VQLLRRKSCKNGNLSSQSSKTGEKVATEDLMLRLKRRGVTVTLTMLKNDVHDGYLPSHPWGAWVLPRATLLYRLRQRGVKGVTLKLILFLRDGWGWEYTKKTVRDGFLKGIRIQQLGIRKVLHKPAQADVSLSMEEIAKEQRALVAARLPQVQAERMTETSHTTLRFILGHGLFGHPLEGGSLSRLVPFARAINRTDDETARAGIELTEQIFNDAKLSWKEMLAILDGIDDETARAAVPTVRRYFRDVRGTVHRATCNEGRPGHPSNPISIFGQSKEFMDKGYWKLAPERLTPSQFLGGVIGAGIVADVVLNRSFAGIILNTMEALERSASNTSQ